MTLRGVAMASVLAFMSCATGTEAPEVTRVGVAGRPSAVVAADGRLWVADDQKHQVHVVDPRSLEVVREIDVERNPVALASGGGRVWVAHASGSIVAISTDGGESETIDVGGSLTGIAYGLGRVWVTDLERDRVVGIAPDGYAKRPVIEVPEGAVRLTVHRGSIWVSGREATVSEVDPKTERIVVHPVGIGPIGIAAVGEEVWVANSDDDNVQRVGDVESVPVGNAPVALVAAAGSIWVANQDGGSVSRITADEAAGAPVELDFRPRGIAQYGGAVWVVGTNPSTVARVDP